MAAPTHATPIDLTVIRHQSNSIFNVPITVLHLAISQSESVTRLGVGCCVDALGRKPVDISLGTRAIELGILVNAYVFSRIFRKKKDPHYPQRHQNILRGKNSMPREGCALASGPPLQD